MSTPTTPPCICGGLRLEQGGEHMRDCPRFWTERGKTPPSSPTTPSDEMTCIGHCGDLRWTVGRWGHVQHKHSCPRRTDTFCQTHPGGCPSTPTTPSGKPEPQTEAGKILLLEHSSQSPHMARHIIAVENEARQSAFLAGLDSPEMLELLTGALHKSQVDCSADETGFINSWCSPNWHAGAAESILASMRSSLRAETDL